MLIAGTGRRSVHNRTLVSGGLRARLTRLLKFSGNTVADYQPGNYTGTLNASAWLNSIGVAPSLAQASGSAQPIILSFSGVKYVYLPAVASNTVTTPTKTITGNFTKTYDIALNDYTPAADVTIDAKTSGFDGFTVKWLTTDKLRLVIGDGAALTNFDATIASGLTDGSRHTITITYVDNSTMDLKIDGVAWGTQVIVNKVLTNAAVSWTLGSATSIGKVYDHTMTNGGATTYYHLNPVASAETSANAATWVSDNGETYTLNNTGTKLAQIVGSPQLLLDGAAMFMQMATTLVQPEFIISVINPITWTGSDIIYDGLDVTHRMTLTQSGVSPSVSIYAGTGPAAPNTSLAVNKYAIHTAQFSGVTSYQSVNGVASASADAGSQGGNGLTLGSIYSGAANFGNIQVKEIIILNAVPSAAKLAQILSLLNSIYAVY